MFESLDTINRYINAIDTFIGLLTLIAFLLISAYFFATKGR